MAEKNRSSYRLSPAAAAFYAQIYPAARAGCCSELRRAGCTEDEAEEVFMATCEKVMSTVDPIARRFAPGQMVVLLKISCKRRLIDERRHRSVLTEVELETASGLAATDRGPDAIAENNETARAIFRALDLLAPLDRLVFEHRHEQELSPREIQNRIPALTARSYRRTIERANAQVRCALANAENPI
jgi:RNA polymerase sigma factor (sigma-70 family)